MIVEKTVQLNAALLVVDKSHAACWLSGQHVVPVSLDTSEQPSNHHSKP